MRRVLILIFVLLLAPITYATSGAIDKDSKTYFIQNPPPKPQKREFEFFDNATIKDIDFGKRLDAYYQCQRSNENDCYKYIRNRYYDINVDLGSGFNLRAQ